MEYVDVAIVGGGVIGANVALEVTDRNPRLSVAVLERNLVGTGASTHSAGVHFPRGATPWVRDLTLRSHQQWHRLRGRFQLPITSVEAFVVADTESRDSVEQAYISQSALQATERPANQEWKAPAGRCVWRAQGCHYADVAGVTRRLFSHLRSQVTIWEGTDVVGIDAEESGVTVTLGQGTLLRAGTVVIAPGPWATLPVWAEPLRDLGVRVKKVAAVHIESVPHRSAPLTIFHDEDAFLVPLHRRGHWLFSYTCDEWDVDAMTMTGQLDARTLASAREVLAQYSPDLAQRCKSGRVFCDAYSPSREPVVAEVAPGVIFAGAANGAGYRLAPAIAQEAAQLVDLRRNASAQT
ncbi:NAD(P)/FAD-dependent oxidoreductase [Natronoglycomyces albus]|uniref:FAD-binding oxidoreductase n=1 Tax=Natronoglycomyces albus TaxID=2811108 RepID=A0A895XP13_9ACTN|nr:FAD-dependent oxidoreductase [Natronoglycomyces albus]QSB06877.1 FAD-binding oxidoreductase [Natronoglycomyces albus]